MSKSLNNAIFLSDDADAVQKKVMGMYTDPKRLRATDPGTVGEQSALDLPRNLQPRHRLDRRAAGSLSGQGKVGDVVIKRRLVEVLNTAAASRSAPAASNSSERPDDVLDILQAGTARANAVAEETLQLAKAAMKQDYSRRTLTIL